jgi:hypothetical protein
VPGLAALNKGYDARVTSLSCWAAGGCAAGGFYTRRLGYRQAFVAIERNGRWGPAIEVPGTAVLNRGGYAQVGSVSCARTGACVAVGTYTDRHKNTRWFTAAERGGRWATAARVPEPALNQALIGTVWCAPGGLCAAGGSFTDKTGTTQAWVMTQTHGRWHAAEEVPGITALNVPGGSAGVNAVVCSSAGNCAAGGSYVFNTSPPPPQNQSWPNGASAFAVTQTKGVWGTAEQVPGITGLNGGWHAGLTLMSCPSAGNCTAAGYDFPGPGCDPGDPTCWGIFGVSEQHGIWASAHGFQVTDINALTCVSAGDCVLGGDVANTNSFATVVTETNGNWGKLRQISGLGEPTCSCQASTVASVFCSSAGYCAAGGTTNGFSAFVASERHGIWGKGVTPAGIPAQYSPNYNNPHYAAAMVNAVACPPRIDLCVAGGFYQGPDGGLRAFLVSQSR